AGLYGSEYQKRGEWSVAATGGATAITTEYFDRFNQLLQHIDPLGQLTSYSYDSARNQIAKTFPELNSEVRSFDMRHNVLSTTKYSKPSDGLAPLLTSTTYYEAANVTRCVHGVTCNSQSVDTDEIGNQTHYTFDPNTGQLTNILAPADPNGVHAQTSY